MVVTGHGVEGHDLRHLELIAREEQFDVDISNVTDDMNVLSIAGPKSGKLLERISSENADDWKFLDAKEVHFEFISEAINLTIFVNRLKLAGQSASPSESRTPESSAGSSTSRRPKHLKSTRKSCHKARTLALATSAP